MYEYRPKLCRGPVWLQGNQPESRRWANSTIGCIARRTGIWVGKRNRCVQDGRVDFFVYLGFGRAVDSPLLAFYYPLLDAGSGAVPGRLSVSVWKGSWVYAFLEAEGKLGWVGLGRGAYSENGKSPFI